jgi:N-succinyldiaminopimelate aminotransferase
VAEKLARDYGLSYDPGREIHITNGATCGLSAALGALVEPGSDVLLPDPVYDAYASEEPQSSLPRQRTCLQPAL